MSGESEGDSNNEEEWAEEEEEEYIAEYISDISEPPTPTRPTSDVSPLSK